MRDVLIPGIGTPVVEEIKRLGLPASVLEWPIEWREAYEERVAIMQFDGQLEPAEAERRAETDCRTLFERYQSAIREGQ